MAAADVGVVHDPHVAGLETALGIGQFDDLLHRELHVGKEHGQAITTLGDGFTGGRVEDAVGAVVGLRDDRRHGRMDQVQIHLVGDLFEAAAHHGQSYWIHHFTFTNRLPLESTTTPMPGSITDVVSLCSTIAGPSNRMPGCRSLRW